LDFVGVPNRRQVELYEPVELCGQILPILMGRADLVVGPGYAPVFVELKVGERITEAHQKQVRRYAELWDLTHHLKAEYAIVLNFSRRVDLSVEARNVEHGWMLIVEPAWSLD
jgi:predicted RecB family nuclease